MEGYKFCGGSPGKIEMNVLRPSSSAVAILHTAVAIANAGQICGCCVRFLLSFRGLTVPINRLPIAAFASDGKKRGR